MNNRMPTTGGWLTMLNGIAWLILAAVPTGAWRGAYYPYLTGCWCVMSLPVAWIFFIPGVGFKWDATGIVATCCVIGLNSFMWGHGLAAILRWLSQRLQAVS